MCSLDGTWYFEHDLFNIQLDVFSKSYVGSPHNHETWGVMSCISGDLGISDYIMGGTDLTLVEEGVFYAAVQLSVS